MFKSFVKYIFVALLTFSLNAPISAYADEFPTPEQLYVGSQSASEQAIASLGKILLDPHTSDTVKADILGNLPLDDESLRRLVYLLGQEARKSNPEIGNTDLLPSRLPFNLEKVLSSFRSNPASMGFAGSIEFVLLLVTLYDFHAGLNSLPTTFETYPMAPAIRFISGNEFYGITSFEMAALATLSVFLTRNIQTFLAEYKRKRDWSVELANANKAAEKLGELTGSGRDGNLRELIAPPTLPDSKDFGNSLVHAILELDQIKLSPPTRVWNPRNWVNAGWNHVTQLFRIESHKNALLRATVLHLKRLNTNEKQSFLDQIKGTEFREKLVWESDPQDWQKFESALQETITEFRSRFPQVTAEQLAASLIERRVSFERYQRRLNEPSARLMEILAVSAITSTIFGYFASWMGKYPQIADGTFTPAIAHSSLDKMTSTLVQMLAPLNANTIDTITVGAGVTTLTLFAAIINFFTFKRATNRAQAQALNRSYGTIPKNLFDVVFEFIINSQQPAVQSTRQVVEPTGHDFEKFWDKVQTNFLSTLGNSSTQKRPTVISRRSAKNYLAAACSIFRSNRRVLENETVITGD